MSPGKKSKNTKTKTTIDEILNETVKKIETQFGEGSIISFDGTQKQEKIDAISTGSYGFDKALGIGGMPPGRLVELYAPEGTGKTSLALHILANAQKRGTCVFIDAEHALDINYAKRIGVDVKKLLLCQPDYGEQGLDILDAFLDDGTISCIVVDSVAALTPRAELEGEMEDHHIGLQARMMGKALRKITSKVKKTNTLVIFINQTRQKIGVTYGDPTVTPGGKALKFFASVRVELKTISAVKITLNGEDKRIGNRIRAKVIKNKSAPPYTTAEFDLIYGEGIDSVGEVIDFGLKRHLIEREKQTLFFVDPNTNKQIKLGAKKAAKEYLAQNKDVFKHLREMLYAD